jgi:hypothetical protein
VSASHIRRCTTWFVCVLAMVVVPATARADTVVNPFSGQWTTTLGGSTPGTVKFSAISAADGASALEAIGGHACGAPTTYYHGDYTDTPSPGMTQTGTMTACTATAGHLVGRWSGSGDTGDIDVTLNGAKTGFDGSFTAPSFGASFTYAGTFVSHFAGDGCCATTPPPPPPSGGVKRVGKLAFVPPASAWNVPTTMVALKAGEAAIEVSPPLAKGQTDATAEVAGTGLDKAHANAATLEKAKFGYCIGIAVTDSQAFLTELQSQVKPGVKDAANEVSTETGSKVSAVFVISLIDCMIHFDEEAASTASVHAGAASTVCAVKAVRVHFKALSTTRINSTVAGHGAPTGLTTTCTRGPTGMTIHLHSRRRDLRSLFGPQLVLGLANDRHARHTATAQVTFSNASPASGPPDLTGAWRNVQDPVSAPAWQLTTSNDRQTLDVTWTGGAGHPNLRGSFHGTLATVNGKSVYSGSFHIVEESVHVDGTATFTIDTANRIEIDLRPNGSGQPSHYVFARVG